jgi:hypothetical protein
MTRRSTTRVSIYKDGIDQAVMGIRAHTPRVNFLLERVPDWAVGTPAKARKVYTGNPLRVTIVLWSKASLDVALRLAKDACNAA